MSLDIIGSDGHLSIHISTCTYISVSMPVATSTLKGSASPWCQIDEGNDHAERSCRLALFLHPDRRKHQNEIFVNGPFTLSLCIAQIGCLTLFLWQHMPRAASDQQTTSDRDLLVTADIPEIARGFT